MPAVRSFSAEVFKGVHDIISPSLVQLAVFGKEDDEPVQLGTGLVLACTREYIGVITTIGCDPAEGYTVAARFGDQNDLDAKVVMRSGPLYGLIILGSDLKAKPCLAPRFYDGETLSSGPVFAVGCQGFYKDIIIVSGLIGVNVCKKWVEGRKLSTLVHTCQIGDGLIGAPVLNRGGEVVGINVARTRQTSQINYAVKMEEFRNMLAELVGTEYKPETGLARLLTLFNEKISEFGSTTGKHGVKRKLEHTSRQ
ncbi:hypothetical protein CFC21_071667 [Triticum aestivum]|uniref:Serine protease n=2 Tax=Triticum aestivum TaxID=4565 RepID=A0A9R1KTA7_WHEAT|nr:uncharacterized protein LOC123111997 isoform X1 [Triticum aestivum]KAF7065576.1 hypothetical protein CFC21_071667 [Triticum aestivum]